MTQNTNAMDEQIKQIAQRLQGLRDVLDLSVEEVAASCGLPVVLYFQMVSGDSDISVSCV